MSLVFKLDRGCLFQNFFHVKRRFTSSQACPVSYTENMGVNSNGGLAKGHVQNNVSRLAPNARQFFKRFTDLWDCAAVIGYQHLAELNDIFGFGIIKAYRLDEVSEPDFT